MLGTEIVRWLNAQVCNLGCPLPMASVSGYCGNSSGFFLLLDQALQRPI